MMQNFYNNKASAHNSVQQLPKTQKPNPTPKPQKTPTKAKKTKKKSLKQTTKSTSFQNNFHFVRKRRTLCVFWAVSGVCIFK
jgi:hypothetical protein